MQKLLTSIFMMALALSFNAQPLQAQVAFDRLTCVEKGYTSKTLEIRSIGDRLLVLIEEPYVVQTHPQISPRYIEFDIPADRCQTGSDGALSCTEASGTFRAGATKSSLQKYSYQSLSFSLESLRSSSDGPGTVVTLKVSGKDVASEFVDDLVFITRPGGDSAFVSYCKIDGALIND
jgi:hypothetical protein